jgi:uncharacterized protein (TIGR01319 family)
MGGPEALRPTAEPRWVACVDIGSTFTKGALFALGPEGPSVAARCDTPTTAADLTRGFDAVTDGLFRAAAASDPRFAPQKAIVRFTSSARGGLRIAALGIVPDLTLAVSRLAAASAGGKIVKSFAYRLSTDDIAALEALDPDIILFTGGTDGGDEKHNLANARALAASRVRSAIIFAGNRAVRDAVGEILAGKEFVAAGNVMPEIGVMDVEPARDAIRRRFIEKIVEGKGLAALVARIGVPPTPTPLALYEFVRLLPTLAPEWDDTCVLDIGGATTDFYSSTESFHGEPSVILRGLLEPKVKRTVEGDLGLRVSAPAVLESGRELIENLARASRSDLTALAAYAERVARETEHMPGSELEARFDAILASTCASLAARRHAGVLRNVYTASGKVRVQKGKDLRKVKRIIGTGGYLARCEDGGFFARALAALVPEPEEALLLPAVGEWHADRDHLMPLLGSLAAEYPREAARILGQRVELVGKAPPSHERV